MSEAIVDDQQADTPLQSAVWMAQELDISMPPVPDIYAGTLNEISLGRIFATLAGIADLDSPGLESLLAEDGDPAPPVTASLLVALSDGLLESAYLDDAERVSALVREAVTRLLDCR